MSDLIPIAGLQSPSGYTSEERQALDAHALGASIGIGLEKVGGFATPVWDYNLFVMNGQSLALGTECWPAKSTTSRADILMLGAAVHSRHWIARVFAPIDHAELVPMTAVVTSDVDGRILSADEVAALPAGSLACGESPLEGALKMGRLSMLASQPWLRTEDRVFVGINSAITGLPIEQLSRGHEERFFDITSDAVRQTKTKVPSQRSFGVAALFFLQGEFNYIEFQGATSDKDRYKQLLATLYDDFWAECVSAITLQDVAPPIITYQTGGRYTNNTVSIGQAQLELALERPGWFLAAPSYPVTDKHGHLDANGSRWLGTQLGKVWHRVAVQGLNWRPLSPVRAVARDRQIVIAFHVPCPPLQFRPCYVGHAETLFPSRGFVVVDDAGVVPCTVSLAGSATVLLDAERPLSGPVLVYYARKDPTNGAGNLCDSDATIAPDPYEYVEGSGDYPSANIPGLVGRPYPLWNWCVAFALRVERDERQRPQRTVERLVSPTPVPPTVTKAEPSAPRRLRVKPQASRSVLWVAAAIVLLALAFAELVALRDTLWSTSLVPVAAEVGVHWRRQCEYGFPLASRQTDLPVRETYDEAARDACPAALERLEAARPR